MFKRIAFGLVCAVAAAGALAVDLTHVDKVIAMKDGSTLYIFKDGKMAMEDKLGRTTLMKPGHVMDTKDGKQVIMIGNELAHLDWIRKSELGGK